MTGIISSTSLSQKEIHHDCITWLQGLDNWNDIKDNVPSSNLNMIINLISGFGSYVLYNNHRLRNETYLSTATMDTSVYAISRAFGYNLNRYTAPTIKVRYTGVNTIYIESGNVVGSYGDQDLIYFGQSKKIEKLDELYVVLGKYNRDVFNAAYVGNTLSRIIRPNTLASVDSKYITMYVDDIQKEISDDIEKYVTEGKCISFSRDPYSTEIIMYDANNDYGMHIDEGSHIAIEYIESDGYNPNIKIKDVVTLSDYIALDVEHLGTSGQSLDHIRTLVPLFYSTQRRMVTQNDHKFITEAHSLIRSAYAEKNKGSGAIYTLSFTETTDNTNTTYSIMLDGKEYSFAVRSVKSSGDLAELMNSKIKDSLDIKSSLVNGGQLIIASNEFSPNDLVKANSSNITVTTKPGSGAKCCTVNLYYIKYNTVSDPEVLTPYEEYQLTEYLEKYKMVGTNIILIPADSMNHDIKLNIRIKDNSYLSAVKRSIIEISKDYTLKLNTKFDYGEFLTKISKITYTSPDGEVVRPVVSVLSKQEMFNIPAVVNKYINFTSITVSEF